MKSYWFYLIRIRDHIRAYVKAFSRILKKDPLYVDHVQRNLRNLSVQEWLGGEEYKEQ